MNKDNNGIAVFGIITMVLVVIAVFVIAINYLPQKTKTNTATNYKSPSIFDITGFFTNAITNTANEIKNTTKPQNTNTETTPTGSTGTEPTDPDISSMLWGWA